MKALGIQTISTTAYHPQSNGLVERMHRQLKASIRTRLSDSDWYSALPFVLLGLRSAWRQGPEAAPSELLYGTLLRLPGEFIATPEIAPTSNTCSLFISSFQARMRAQRAAPSNHHPISLRPSFIPPSLRDSTMVLVRVDGVLRPLQAPYDGPFQVLSRGEKTFDILKNNKTVTVSVARLKPAFLSDILPPADVRPVPSVGPATVNVHGRPRPPSSARSLPPSSSRHRPSFVSRSGRHVRPPERLFI